MNGAASKPFTMSIWRRYLDPGGVFFLTVNRTRTSALSASNVNHDSSSDRRFRRGISNPTTGYDWKPLSVKRHADSHKPTSISSHSAAGPVQKPLLLTRGERLRDHDGSDDAH